ncbi:MAG: energy-coupling factor transporter ATPase [Mollicutes bacterium PWAP]|nr:energy-coupling factor transporter ATPase [Mollicutes bacterium PWAP]
MLKVKNLFFKYSGSDYYAVENLSFEIKKGEHVAILGHNGSGKSTLSKIIVGLLRNEKGSISIDDIKMNRANTNLIRRKIGTVFQNPENQFVGSTVKDDIAFGLENFLIPREIIIKKIDFYLKLLNISNKKDSEPHTLSAGEKQKVAIASTLALEQDIIIFDEATSMLDPKSKNEVLGIIEKIKKNQKKTIISITHDMEEAKKADRLIVLSHGKIIADGIPYDVLSNKEVVKEAKIDTPFIYKISEKLGMKPTFDEKKLLEKLWK